MLRSLQKFGRIEHPAATSWVGVGDAVEAREEEEEEGGGGGEGVWPCGDWEFVNLNGAEGDIQKSVTVIQRNGRLQIHYFRLERNC
jgi:hypothetical protein